LLWLFFTDEVMNYLFGPALNSYPPDLSLPRNWDDRQEILASGFLNF
jgi:hypothetical protein